MRYRVRRDVTSLQEIGGKVSPGEIIIHRSGNLLLNCPKCGKIQFTANRLEGSDEAPDVVQPIQCGGGYCKRCGVWFRIITGQAEIVAAPEKSAVAIPDRLQSAGVTPPPKPPEGVGRQ